MPTCRRACVATKTADQLDLQALHRVCERVVSQRTGIINQIRVFLLERSIAVRQGLRFTLRGDAVQKLPGPIQNALPRAETGHKDSTLPLRTPTYQS